MPAFKATEAAEALDYDFRPFYDEQGAVAEPSDDQVSEFYAAMTSTIKDGLGEDDPRLLGVDLTDPEQVGKLYLKLTADDHRKMYARMLEVHAAVTGDKPSREALEALPYRVRQAWYGAVQGWLRPESSAPATND